jgi:hypothetical protein
VKTVKGLLKRAVVLVSIFSGSMALAQKGDAKPLSDLPRQFAAQAFGQSGSMAGRSFGLNIYVTGWTPDGKLEEYLTILKEKGRNGLVKALDKSPEVGRVAPIGSVGNTFRYARFTSTPEGGLHIVLVSNRLMSFGEMYRNSRSVDYQFGIVVLDVGPDGKGTGLLAPACKIKFNKKNELEIEHLGQKPLRLANVFLQK